jgi:hypothetical protein
MENYIEEIWKLRFFLNGFIGYFKMHPMMIRCTLVRVGEGEFDQILNEKLKEVSCYTQSLWSQRQEIK